MKEIGLSCNVLKKFNRLFFIFRAIQPISKLKPPNAAEIAIPGLFIKAEQKDPVTAPANIFDVKMVVKTPCLV